MTVMVKQRCEMRNVDGSSIMLYSLAFFCGNNDESNGSRCEVSSWSFPSSGVTSSHFPIPIASHRLRYPDDLVRSVDMRIATPNTLPFSEV